MRCLYAFIILVGIFMTGSLSTYKSMELSTGYCVFFFVKCVNSFCCQVKLNGSLFGIIRIKSIQSQDAECSYKPRLK